MLISLAILILLVIVALAACSRLSSNQSKNNPFGFIRNIAARASATPNPDSEMEVLWLTEQQICPTSAVNPYSTPQIHVENNSFTLTCLFSAGHATTVQISRFDSAAQAYNEFQSITADQTHLEFYGHPSAIWGEKPPDTPNSLRRIYMWQQDVHIFRIDSFDETPNLTAPDPGAVAEIVRNMSIQEGLIDK